VSRDSALQLAVCLMAAFALGAPAMASASTTESGGGPSLRWQVMRLQARLDAQSEARDRQADAFDAAASRMEVVNGALVGAITLAAVLGSLLAIRWVRQLAHQQIASQVETAMNDIGREVFEADSAALRSEYDEKFASLYRRYHQLVEAD
jgi:hypothetical protein